MRKFHLILFTNILTIAAFGQSVYMHEAQQEAEENGSSGFYGIFSLLVFFGVIYLICKIWPSKKNTSNQTNNSSYGDKFDEELQQQEAEYKEELTEMELIDQLCAEQNDNLSFNSYDYSPIKTAPKKDTKIISNKPKYHPSSGDAYFDKIICEIEAKYFPEGSIEERLRGLAKDGLVDLGLSVNWSSKNIGASKVYDMGYYFRWGCMDYIEHFHEDNLVEYSKIQYDKEIDNIEESISGKIDYDPVFKFTQGVERLPTTEEFQELINNCSWEYIEIEKYKGFIITGPSGKSIYLPMSYHSFVNCMYQMMMAIREAYWAGDPKNDSDFYEEGHCAYALGIANKNHDTKDFNIEVASYFKKRFSPIRGVGNK